MYFDSSIHSSRYGSIDVDRPSTNGEEMNVIHAWVLFLPDLKRFNLSLDR